MPVDRYAGWAGAQQRFAGWKAGTTDDFSNSTGGFVPLDRESYPDTFFRNPPLQGPETAQYGYPYHSQLQRKLFRGWIMEAPNPTGAWTPPNNSNKLFRMNFHFNPSDISMDWSVADPSFLPTPGQALPLDATSLYSTTGVTFGFNLFLDRVGDKHPEVKYWGGVNSDIRILNAIMASGQQPGDQTFSTPAPVLCVLGRRYVNAIASTQDLADDRVFGGAPKPYPLSMTGYVNSMNVSYQRFDSEMTPLRAVVSITINVLTYTPATVGAAQPDNSPGHGTSLPRKSAGDTNHRKI